MSNQIRLKRGSGSDPSASDLVTGEIAIRTDNGKLFTKRDNGNVTEITGGGGIDDGDKGDITVSNSGGTFTIDNGVVNNAKVASNAAIAGSKISPDFGPQDIVTTGNIDLSLPATASNIGVVFKLIVTSLDGASPLTIGPNKPLGFLEHFLLPCSLQGQRQHLFYSEGI